MYQAIYPTPAGFSDLLLTGDGEFLTGLTFLATETPVALCEEGEIGAFSQARRWLDGYFAGQVPDFIPRYRLEGLTPFRREVLEIVGTIPYGQSLTYGEIATLLARRRGRGRVSPQAVGGAVGGNPLCLILPCHRVLGAGGTLTGYGGGLPNKAALLRLEGIPFRP